MTMLSLVVIPAGNLLLPLSLLSSLSFPQGICFCLCLCFSRCHSRRESASAFAFAFLVVIPAGNLLLPLPLLSSLSFPQGICFCCCFCFPWLSFPQGICFCCCFCFPRCHSRRESASAFAFAFLVVIPAGNLLLLLPLLFSLSFPQGICCTVSSRDSLSSPHRPCRVGGNCDSGIFSAILSLAGKQIHPAWNG